MQVTAKLRHLRIAPRKVRLVADSIRGLDVLIAQNSLQLINKKTAKPILKLLNSAIANAENNFKLKKDNLYISELRVDEGPVLKRWQPRAFGRASAIHKKTSHISIILDENKDIKKDVKIVKSLDEVKKLEKKEKNKDKKIDEKIDEKKPNIDKGGIKKMFRRKSI